MNRKKMAKEVFAPVIRKIDRLEIIPQYKDECWSIDLTDHSSLSKYNKNFKFNFPIIDNYTKYAWTISPKDKSEKSTTQAFKTLIEKEKRKQSVV